MKYSCPCCDREFANIVDYPRVYITKFERLEIPKSIILPDSDYEIYVGPKSRCNNKRPPTEVIDFFKNNREASEYDIDDATWMLESRIESLRPRAIILKPTMRSRIEKIFREANRKCQNEQPLGEEGEDWEIGSYRRSRKDATKAIIKEINPYFDRLEKLVGKEVDTKEVLYNKKSEGHYTRIKDTRYTLDLLELDSGWGRQILEQNKLVIPSLETQEPCRKLAFVLASSGGGSISAVHYHAVLGGLAYQGKLLKHS